MTINLKKKKFLSFFKTLQKRKNLVYTKEELIQLKIYSSFLFDSFLFKRQDLYFKLFVNFLNTNISGDEFSKQLINLRANHINEFDELMNQLEINSEFLNKFDVNINAFGFGDLIDLVEQYCDSFISDELLIQIGGSRETGEINETQFRNYIEKAFLQLRINK
jgi:hypothetical protein